MRNQNDIEQLFKQVRVPELREGLKKEILAAIGSSEMATYKAVPIIPLFVKWALAASIMLAVMLNIFAVYHKKTSMATLVTVQEKAPVEIENELLEEYGIYRRFAFSAPARITVDLQIRRIQIEQLMKGGGYNDI